MSEQTRRAPGRPKKSQEVVEVQQPVVKTKAPKRPAIRQKQQEVTHRIYEIERGGGVVTILRQKEIQEKFETCATALVKTLHT